MVDDLLQWPVTDEEVIRTFPPVLRAVVKALGLGRASQFLEQHGGVNHTLPKHKSTALGLNDEELKRMRIALQPHMDHSGRLWLPKPDKLLIKIRNEQIVKGSSSQSISEQVRTFKLSNRQIMNVRRALTKDERTQQSRVKRHLSFDGDELNALKNLTEEKMRSHCGHIIYARILNKLNRAALHASHKANAVQFDLF